MKRFLSMFAFATAIVFSAFALASCSSDDDDDTVSTKHKFTIVTEMYTSKESAKAEVAELNRKMNQRINDNFQREVMVPMTDANASILWFNIMNEFDEANQEIAEAGYEDYDDTEFYLTVKMMKEGQTEPFKQKTYRPRGYILN